MMVTNKGVDMIYEKVLEIFTALDFSSNRFVGDISKSIGNLKGLHLLNLSNNILTGCIPPTLGDLAVLESLDLSQNKLSREISQQLTQLTSLEFFNVSHNHLVGPIPHGKQFNTFENNSFEVIWRKCKIVWKSIDKDSGSLLQFGWKIFLVEYGFGLVVGVTIGHVVSAKNHDWLIKYFGSRQLVPRRKVRVKGVRRH